MLKRRLKQAGLPAHYSPHSFRATGITNFLENDGTLEAAQRIAGHADSRTTKLYDRRGQKVLLEDMERNAELHFAPNAEYNKMWSTTDRWTLDGAFKGFYSAFFPYASAVR
jgi:integrase